MRIIKAKQLLSHTQKSIQEICFEAGFNNISHFNHVFRNIVGCTPTEFKKPSGYEG